MDVKCIVNRHNRCDLARIKEFISGGGGVLKPFPELCVTALEYMLENSNDFLSTEIDEVILYLIEEETKALRIRNIWNVDEWNKYLCLKLYNNINEKFLLKLIHLGSANIINFKINVEYVYSAIDRKYNGEILTNLLKYCCENELRAESDTLLVKAIKSECGIDVIKLLVDAGANLHYIYCGKCNLFYHIRCQCCYGDTCKSKHIIDFLVKSRVDIKAFGVRSDTTIHRTNCHYLISVAIKNGVSIEQKNEKNYTPLMLAIKNSRVKKAKILLQFGADPNSALILYHNHPLRGEEASILMDLFLYHGADYFAHSVNNKPLINFLLSLSNKFMYDLKKIVYYYLFFMSTNDFCDNFPQLGNSHAWSSFLKLCEVEQDKMKSTVLNDGLTLYEFCHLKKFYESKFVDVSVSKFGLNNEKITEDFPIYHNFIKIRIRDNVNKRWEKILRDILENIIIAPLNNQDDMLESIELNYDCLDCLSKFLNSEDLNVLFLAST